MAQIIIIRHYYCYYVVKFAPLLQYQGISELILTASHGHMARSYLFIGLPHLLYLHYIIFDLKNEIPYIFITLGGGETKRSPSCLARSMDGQRLAMLALN